MALKFKGNCFEPTDNSVGNDVSFGTFSSTAAVSGNKISSSKTKMIDICADDGGANFGTTDLRAVRARLLLTAAQSGAASYAAIMGQVKNTAADTTTGNRAGVKGYYEAAGSATVAANSCGVLGMIDVPSGSTIAAGTVGAFTVASVDLGGTHTGKAVGVNFTEALTGAFDAAFAFPTGSEFITSSQLTGGTSQYIKILINGTAYTVAATCA